MSNELRNFLALSYEELEELNLKAKKQRLDRVAIDKIQEERIKYLTDEKRIKAVTVLFSDLEGRLHMLDYDKKVSDQELGQPDVRRLVDSRIYGAARKRFAAGDGLGRVLLGPGGHFRHRQGAGVRRSDRQGRLAVQRGHSRSAEGLRDGNVRRRKATR